MPISFPSSPSVNDTYTINGRVYVWTGSKWRRQRPAIASVSPSMSVSNDFSAGGSALHVDSTNSSVGIGTSSPNASESLTVGGDTSITGNLSVTGIITVPTQVSTTNDTKVATTEFVQTAISNLIGGAPAALDTLNELAAAINDDSSYAASITTSLAGKSDTSHTHSYAASSHTHSYAATDHNHTYNVNNSWLRDNGDNAHVKMYGNSRQMVFRTDGTTEYASGVSTFAFLWMYGGDAASNRRMGLNSSGQLWTSNYGYLHDKFAALSHSHSYAASSHSHSYAALTGSASYDFNIKVAYVNEVAADNGSASDVSFMFKSDTDTGMYRNTTNSLGFSTGGTRRTVIHSNGDFWHYGQGLFPSMSGTTGYNTVRYGVNGQLLKYTSSIEIKEDIVSIKPLMDYMNERSIIYDLRPVLFHQKDNEDGTNNTRGEYVAGMIAQEVLEVAPELCYYDHNGKLTSWGIEAMIPHIVAELQRLAPMIESLYADANPDWVAPTPRPPERAVAERELYDEAAAAQALVGLPDLSDPEAK